MPLHDARSLLAVLHEHDLVAKSPLDGLRPLAGQFPAAADLARELVRRGLITPFQANEIMQDRAGRLVLGQYLLLERLGQGGMGEVFKARHRVLDRPVALKVIRAEYVDRPEAIERFRRECRAAGQLSHPNIVTVHDAYQVGNIHFLAMEYLEGRDLARLVKERGALPPGEACEYARQAALGLQHAHEKGMVHRDVKPANLMRTTAGVVKVLDMGLARLRAGSDAEPRSDLTQAGSVMGTPDYIAPEQAAGNTAQADTRSDVYSLGCTLFHLLAGRPPFLGKTIHEKIAAHLNQPPPSLDSIRPGLPAGLSAVVRRMMEKAPAARYPTPGAVAAALAPYCQAPAAVPPSAPGSVPAGPVTTTLTQYPRPPRRFPWRWAAAAGAALVLLVASCGVGSWLLSSPPSGLGIPPAVKPPEAGTPHDKDNVAVHNPKDGPRPPDPPGPNPGPNAVDPVVALAPPPKHVAVRDGLPWPPKELVALLGDESGRHWGDVSAVACRPNGKIVATADSIDGRSFIHLWDAETLHERAAWTPAGVIVMGMAYSPDGRRLAAVCGDGVRLWDAGDDGLSHERLFGAPGAGPGSNIFHLMFTLDGKWLLTRDAAEAVRRWRLTDRDPVEDDAPVLAPKNSSAPRVVSADGRLEAFSRSVAATGKYQLGVKTLFDQDPNERVVELSAVPVVLSLSADGKRLAAHVGFGAGELRFWDVDDKGLQERKKVDLSKVGGVVDFQSFPSSFPFTPDGAQVVCAISPRTGEPRILFIDATTAEVKELGDMDSPASDLSFSADGKSLAVVGRDHRLRLWEDAGAGFVARKTGPVAAGVVRRLSFRPNGADLAVLSRMSDRPEWAPDPSNLAVWDWTKGRCREVFPGMGWFTDGAYAPDGARLFATGASTNKAAPFGAREGFLRVWQADALKEEEPPRLPAMFAGTSLEALTFDRTGKTLALLGGDDFTRKACICDVQPFRERGKSFEVGRQLESLALSPDGLTAAVVDARRDAGQPLPIIKFWDLKNIENETPVGAEPTPPLEGAAAQTARRLTFSPDGKTIAALVQMGAFSDDARKVFLVDVATGKTRATDEPNGQRPSRVAAFAFSPDGSTLATTDAGGRVALRRADTLELKGEWEFPGPVTAVAFSPGGDYLAVGDGDGTVAVLRLPAPVPPGGK